METGVCDFDLTLKSPRLRPVCFNSRSNRDYEEHYHSFVGETVCGRWAIAHLKRYLWGVLFYWMCDCSAVKEILEYNGSSHQLRRWCQELMGYNFAIIHRKVRMMRDVDALSRRFGKAITLHVMQAHLMRSRDVLARSLACSLDHFHASSKPQRVLPSCKPISQHGILPMKEEVHNSLDIPSRPSAKILYHTAITIAPTSSNSILPLASNRTNVHSPSIIHHSPVWLSLDTIFPFVGDRISTWPGNPLDHHVFESSLMSQRIAQAASTRSTVHLLSLPHLLYTYKMPPPVVSRQSPPLRLTRH